MAEVSLPSNAFEPVTVERRVQQLTRPSLSYWQDAWLRLKRNRRALASAYIIVALLAFTTLGPLLWRVDPASQDVDQVSQTPWAGRTATVVPPYSPWEDTQADARTSDDSAKPLSLAIAAPANTQAVRLVWTADPQASGYLIYRNIMLPGPEHDLGLPLGEVVGSDQTRFEDRLDLDPMRYYYSVVPLDADGMELAPGPPLAVDVTRVITAELAVARGLVPQTRKLADGDAVRLALHPFGTDYLGRDLLARLMYGARVSLFIGIVAPFFFVLIGILYGRIGRAHV